MLIKNLQKAFSFLVSGTISWKETQTEAICQTVVLTLDCSSLEKYLNCRTIPTRCLLAGNIWYQIKLASHRAPPALPLPRKKCSLDRRATRTNSQLMCLLTVTIHINFISFNSLVFICLHLIFRTFWYSLFISWKHSRFERISGRFERISGRQTAEREVAGSNPDRTTILIQYNTF